MNCHTLQYVTVSCPDRRRKKNNIFISRIVEFFIKLREYINKKNFVKNPVREKEKNYWYQNVRPSVPRITLIIVFIHFQISFTDFFWEQSYPKWVCFDLVFSPIYPVHNKHLKLLFKDYSIVP